MINRILFFVALFVVLGSMLAHMIFFPSRWCWVFVAPMIFGVAVLWVVAEEETDARRRGRR